MTVRSASLADLEAITQIYNDAILNTTATFDTEPKTLEDQKRWFLGHSQRHPILVCEREGEILGWASLSPWSNRCAYSDAAEASVYVRSDHRRQGIGKTLLKALISCAREAGLHTIIGRIAAGNQSSLRLARSCGFDSVGTMREVGFKFGRRLDVHIVQLMLNPPAESLPHLKAKGPNAEDIVM
jgi:phosphinothricin acetyltransferase